MGSEQFSCSLLCSRPLHWQARILRRMLARTTLEGGGLKPRSAKRSTLARVDDTAELRARLREAESRLRALEERHELTMGAIRESVYDWDIARGAFSVSKSMQAMLGLPP